MVSSINVTGTSGGRCCNKFADLIRMAFQFLKHHPSGNPSILFSDMPQYPSDDFFFSLFAKIFSGTPGGKVNSNLLGLWVAQVG